MGEADDGQDADRRVHWPSAREAQLLELLERRDLSASGIADRLGVTKNAVIGKVHRMKMTITRKLPPGPVVARVRVRWPPAKQRPLPHAVAPPAPIEPAAFLARLIEDIGAGECRYPHGDYPPFLYCAQPTKPGSPYCPFHHARCFYPVHR